VTDPSSRSGSSVSAFFVLTFLLSLPFYGLNALAHFHVLGEPELGPLFIGLFTAAPIASAVILTFRRRGSRGVKELLKRSFDFKRIPARWYLPTLLLGPLILLLSVGALVMTGASIGTSLIPLVALPIVFLLFFVMAAGEEVGWMGHAFEPMQKRAGALRAALVLGVIWALWHVPFFVFLMPHPVVLGAQVLTLVGNRVLVAWIFNNTGKSVFAAILFHAADNTALVILPDIHANAPWGAVTLSGLTLVAAAAATLLWGSETLARFKVRHPA